jgi:biotin operon repressor
MKIKKIYALYAPKELKGTFHSIEALTDFLGMSRQHLHTIVDENGYFTYKGQEYKLNSPFLENNTMIPNTLE